SRSTAQTDLSYKKLVTKAKADEAAGNYAEAAAAYRAAFDQKPRKQENCYRAAELYTRIRDYQQAAEAYQFLERDEDRWPLLGLQYGRALKQDGRYDEARRALATFLETYNGADRLLVAEIVRNELAGIQLARQWRGRETLTDLARPGRGINTGADEFGAVAVAGDQLFFTSTAGGQSRLYQSRLQAREWTKATVPPGFPVIAEGDFGTGCFSADGKVFYFTICSGLSGEDATNRCEIFRGERSVEGRWSQPERLSATVNQTGVNNAFPAVSTDADGRVVLHFASDRPGGRGGMDIYSAVQISPDAPTEFSSAVAAPNTINTVGDEVTPVFDVAEQVLYFASNGHPSLGGLDLFKAKRTLNRYGQPENLGPPVNSAADDYGLSRTSAGTVGYLTSNRTLEGVRTTTTETDIFSLNFRAGRAKLKATVYDNTTGAELGGAAVTLLQLNEDGQTVEVGQQTFPTGVYTFDLQAGSRYRVIIRREHYQGAEYQVETKATGSALYGQPVFLRRNATGGSTPEPITLPNPPRGGSPGNGQNPAPTTSSAPATPPAAEPIGSPQPTSAPAPDSAPLAYRIQISAQRKFDPQAGKYEAIRYLGNLTGTPIPGRNLQRITVGYFTDAASAKTALNAVQSKGFPSAFVVKFQNGKRIGQVRL
ncbi:MAG: tetratricopeptide repeat protein, partial [Bacteroidota bacterium]